MSVELSSSARAFELFSLLFSGPLFHSQSGCNQTPGREDVIIRECVKCEIKICNLNFIAKSSHCFAWIQPQTQQSTMQGI